MQPRFSAQKRPHMPGGSLTGKEEQTLISRVEHLTSAQIADRILSTDLAVHIDSMEYIPRRSFSAGGRTKDSQVGARCLGGSYPSSRSTRL